MAPNGRGMVAGRLRSFLAPNRVYLLACLMIFISAALAGCNTPAAPIEDYTAAGHPIPDGFTFASLDDVPNERLKSGMSLNHGTVNLTFLPEKYGLNLQVTEAHAAIVWSGNKSHWIQSVAMRFSDDLSEQDIKSICGLHSRYALGGARAFHDGDVAGYISWAFASEETVALDLIAGIRDRTGAEPCPRCWPNKLFDPAHGAPEMSLHVGINDNPALNHSSPLTVSLDAGGLAGMTLRIASDKQSSVTIEGRTEYSLGDWTAATCLVQEVNVIPNRTGVGEVIFTASGTDENNQLVSRSVTMRYHLQDPEVTADLWHRVAP